MIKTLNTVDGKRIEPEAFMSASEVCTQLEDIPFEEDAERCRVQGSNCPRCAHETVRPFAAGVAKPFAPSRK